MASDPGEAVLSLLQQVRLNIMGIQMAYLVAFGWIDWIPLQSVCPH